MKDRTNDHLHILRVVTKNIQGIITRVIHTIGGGISIRKSKDPKLKGPSFMFGPDICLAPLNCFAHNLSNLGGGKSIRFGV